MSFTTRISDRAFVRAMQASLLGFALALAACEGSANADRTALLERADAARLTGTWDITLVLERSIAQRDSARGHERAAAGTIAFTENRSSDLNVADFGVVTHKGVYDLDLSSFRLPPATDSRIQVAMARTAVVHPAHDNIAGDDSVFVVLNPGDSQLSVRLTGALAGDTVAGAWVAEFVRSQASGRFVMRRHHA